MLINDTVTAIFVFSLQANIDKGLISKSADQQQEIQFLPLQNIERSWQENEQHNRRSNMLPYRIDSLKDPWGTRERR